jgi:hypothetical protein
MLPSASVIECLECVHLFSERIAMQIKRNAYVLILFTLLAQFDDALVTLAASFQSAPLPSDDDDGCLPPARPERQERCCRRQPQSISVKRLAANFSFFARSLLPKAMQTTPFAPPPLYLFSSLQI